MKTYVALSDFDPLALKRLSEATSLEVRTDGHRPDVAELCELAGKNDVLIIGAKEQMTGDVYAASTSLRIIGTTSVGLDHVAKEFLEDSAMTVINTPLANVISVAEFSMGAILALVKRFLPAAVAGISGSGRPGVGGKTHDINGMTLGIIGAGRIGTRLASLAEALGMDVVVWTRDPSRHPEVAGQFVELDELLSKSDVISVNLPLTPETSGLLTANMIRSLALNQYLVNTSRFAIMDEEATVEMVSNQSIAGIAIDGEIPDSVRLSVPDGFNAILTPHIAGISSEALGRMDMELVDALLPVLGRESENR